MFFSKILAANRGKTTKFIIFLQYEIKVNYTVYFHRTAQLWAADGNC